MQVTTILSGTMTSVDGEHLPPLDDPQAWALSWERQIDFLCAWQEASANSDGEACQWRETAPPAAGDTRLTMQTVVRANTLNVALRERLLNIASEMSNIAIAEIGARKDAAVGGARPGASPEPLSETNAERLRALTRSWFELVNGAQQTMSALTGYGLREPGVTANPAPSSTQERRQRVVRIDFADRRRAG